MTNPRRFALVGFVAMTVLLAGCAATPSTHPSALASVAPRSGTHFAATLSGVSIGLLRPALLAPKPNAQSSTFVSFLSSANENDFVRILVPSTVCVPGSATPTPTPTDYVAYLHSQTQSGATITGEDSISIDGVSGTELTLGGSRDIQGSIGQSEGQGCSDDHSFGVASDLSLRMAIFRVHGKTVLVWARTDAQAPTPGFFDTFQKMLQTVTLG